MGLDAGRSRTASLRSQSQSGGRGALYAAPQILGRAAGRAGGVRDRRRRQPPDGARRAGDRGPARPPAGELTRALAEARKQDATTPIYSPTVDGEVPAAGPFWGPGGPQPRRP